jgi:hypothetical protein
LAQFVATFAATQTGAPDVISSAAHLIFLIAFLS